MRYRQADHALIALALIALALVALTACGDDEGTTLRLRVAYEDGWRLDGLRLAAGDRATVADLSREVVVRVPDAWAGVPLRVDLWGLRTDRAWAYGGAIATPVRGAAVPLDVVLTRVPCGAWCTVGATTCAGDGVSVCEPRDADECLEWSEPVPCGADAPYCSLGECRATCVDECAAGEARCEGPGVARACGQADADECLEWVAPVACEDGEVCAAGACRARCLDECDAGEATCAGSARLECADHDGDGCAEWGPAAPCPDGACDAGACAERCGDDCEASACTGLEHSVCGQFDFDPCLDLSPGASCVPTDPCAEGRCADATGCDAVPRACDDPPTSTCLDDDTLRVFEPSGTCAGAGGCDYPHRDLACPGCPGCDLCAGLDCSIEPDPICVDGQTLRTFDGVGECVDGVCAYQHDDTTCTGGCLAGACRGNRIDAGGTHTCALRADGQISCWGLDLDGQTDVPPGTYRGLSAGADFTCALRLDGTAACWGEDGHGEAEAPAGAFVRISAGRTMACAIARGTRRLVCWGQVPLAPPPAGTFRAVSVSHGFACGLRTSGAVACWGENQYGQADAPAGDFAEVSVGTYHACAIRAGDRHLVCWGLDNANHLATPPAGAFAAISCSSAHSCGLRTNGEVACWGLANDGETADPGELFGDGFTAVTAGGRHNCVVLASSGEVRCWGNDDYGQLEP